MTVPVAGAPTAAVATVGLPALSADGACPLPPLAAPSSAGSRDWLDPLDRLLATAPVVVVCLERDRARVQAAARLARRLLDTSGVAVVAVSAGPLGAAVVADAAAAAARAATIRAGDVPRFVRRAPTALVDLAVVGSVADLDLPGLSLAHHVASYLPGRTPFLVQVLPRQRVERLRGDVVPSLDGVIGAGPLTATAIGGPLPTPLVAWLHTLTLPVPAPRPHDSVVGQWWRSADAVELVVYPADPLLWAPGATAGILAGTCDWCGAPGVEVGGSCPFCGQQAASDR
jgi:hypothetical protein